ncbi:sodium:solute symporter family protein [Rubrobacter naiadicus]|uniref:sodium:solute symporter family protein n=1 Tax=Rubrobacter naiadicus TaxID=1392641 RepID=UPI003B5B9099
MNVALAIILVFLLLAIYLGIRARRGKDMDLEQWAVGGRGFGTIFVFLLLAGEIYTTFTFLGGSGWAYGEGGPAFYILSYGSLAYVISYWLLPAIWRYGREKRLHSQADFFASKYESRSLGVLVSIVAVVAMVPSYLVLQLKGLGLIVSVASYGAISSNVAITIGAAAVTLYVMISGIRGSAWTAVIKDIMVLSVAVFLGIYFPLKLYGGMGEMFHRIQQHDPGFLALPHTGYNVVWFVSTVLLTALGFYMWPHTFGSIFSAREARVFRRNAVYLPLYQLILLFVFLVGFAAILAVPGLKGDQVDLALLRLSRSSFDPWLVGLIGAAGLLTALVPGSMLLMTSATILSKNVYRAFVPSASEERVNRLAKALVPVVALVAWYFTINSGKTIVILLLLGYSFVTQLFPSLISSLLPNNFVNKWGAAAGIIVGVAIVTYATVGGLGTGDLLPFLPPALADINNGVVALVANAIVTVGVSLATRPFVARSSAPTT